MNVGLIIVLDVLVCWVDDILESNQFDLYCNWLPLTFQKTFAQYCVCVSLYKH